MAAITPAACSGMGVAWGQGKAWTRRSSEFDGLSVRPADPTRTERLEFEGSVDRQVFGWAVVRPLKRALLGRPERGAPGAYER